MLDLHKCVATTKSDREHTVLRRQIQCTDHEIDHIIYELYELTDEEIAIVEGERPQKSSCFPENYQN